MPASIVCLIRSVDACSAFLSTTCWAPICLAFASNASDADKPKNAAPPSAALGELVGLITGEVRGLVVGEVVGLGGGGAAAAAAATVENFDAPFAVVVPVAAAAASSCDANPPGTGGGGRATGAEVATTAEAGLGGGPAIAGGC